MLKSRAFQRLENLVDEWERPFRSPPSPCVGCGQPLDASSGLPGESPNEGDLSTCVHCGAFHVFCADMSLRGLTEAELSELPADVRAELEEARDLLRAAKMPVKKGARA